MWNYEKMRRSGPVLLRVEKLLTVGDTRSVLIEKAKNKYGSKQQDLKPSFCFSIIDRSIASIKMLVGSVSRGRWGRGVVVD